MTPFTTINSIAVPLLRDNVDTDAIIPSREMTSTGRTGLAAGLFAPWRYRDAQARLPDPDFALNQPAAQSAGILLGGANFGCGSSREHAVWALLEYGLTCVIAQGFAPIFAANCLRNGLLAITLAPDVIAALAWQQVTVDLSAQTVSWSGRQQGFTIAAEAKRMLLAGLDVIDLTLQAGPDIATWTAGDRSARPWVYLGKAP